MTRQRWPRPLPALLTVLCLFAGRSAAQVKYRVATTTCSDETVLGTAIGCCTGECLAGPGLCENSWDECLDPATPPSCASNQVYTFRAREGVDAGIGICAVEPGLLIDSCNWAQYKYSYTCCDCPAGFVAVSSGCTDPLRFVRHFFFGCVGCSQPEEVLTYDAATDDFVCKPSLLCTTAKAASSTISELSLLTTWAGALCPMTTPTDMLASLLGSIDAVMQAIIKPSNGFFGTKYNAASSVIAGVSALALGLAVIAGAPVEVPVALVLPVLITKFCGGVATASAALFIGGKVAELVDALSCPSSPSPQKEQRSVPLELALPVRRDGGLFNPCAEFVALFPDDSGSVAATIGACNDVAWYDAASIADPDLADAISTVQQACAGLQDSNQLGAMQDLMNLLRALEEAIPYCDADPTLSSTSAALSRTSPSASATTFSSIPPSASATSSSVPASESDAPTSIPASSAPPSSSTYPSSTSAPSSAPPSSSTYPSSASQRVSSSSTSSSTRPADSTPISTASSSSYPRSTASRKGGCHRKADLRKYRHA